MSGCLSTVVSCLRMCVLRWLPSSLEADPAKVLHFATPLKSFIRAPGMPTLWNVPPHLSPRRSYWLLKHFPSLASKRFIILHDCLTLAVPSTRAGTQQHRGACELTSDQGLGLSLHSGSLRLATYCLSQRKEACVDHSPWCLRGEWESFVRA